MPKNLSGETRLFPIIGDPIIYVKSPQQLSAGFEKRKHNALCVPMQVGGGDLDVVMAGLSHTPNVDGLLVTMPHKNTAFEHCTTSDKTSTLLRAVSVMRRNDDGSWHGGMLDGMAFVKAQIDHGAQPKDAKVLLVGAGAAGGAIAIALLEAGVRELIIHDTDESKVTKLIEALDKVSNGRAKSGDADPSGCTMVCNATPMGLKDGDPLPVEADSLKDNMFVGDVIAGHGTTPFLQAAEKAGCKTANGVQMVEAVQEMMLDFMLNK
jgi:shikimate dehydrogenase